LTSLVRPLGFKAIAGFPLNRTVGS